MIIVFPVKASLRYLETQDASGRKGGGEGGEGREGREWKKEGGALGLSSFSVIFYASRAYGVFV